MSPGLLVTIFGLAMLFAAGLAGLSRARLVNLREDLQDVRGARDDFKSERDESQAREAIKDAELQRRDAEIQVLRASLTGKVEWSAVIEALHDHDAKAADTWAQILEELAEIRSNTGGAE